MIHHFALSLTTVVVAVCSLTACTADSEYDYSPSNNLTDYHIRFVPMEVGHITRGAKTTAGDITCYGVSCAIYSATNSYSTAECGSYFYNEKITTATETGKYYWPGSNYKLSFYAYMPYGNSNLVLSSNATKTGFPSYTYTVPQSTAAQVDVMTADTMDIVAEATSTPVKLYFRHRLADLRFKVTNHFTTPLTVKSISIGGMKYTGTWQNPSWSLTGEANTVSSYPFIFKDETVIEAGDTVDITGESNHFMVLPQTISAGTTFLQVKILQDDKENIYTHELDANLTLSMSKSYTFTLMLGKSGFIVDTGDPEINDWKRMGSDDGEEAQTVKYGAVDLNDWNKTPGDDDQKEEDPLVDSGTVDTNDWDKTPGDDDQKEEDPLVDSGTVDVNDWESGDDTENEE